MINFGRALQSTSFIRNVQRRAPQQLRHIYEFINRIDDSRRFAGVAIIDNPTEPGITYGYLAERSRCVADAISDSTDPSVKTIGKRLDALSLLECSSKTPTILYTILL